MALKILGDEVPEAVKLFGPGTPADLDGVVLFWDSDTEALIERGLFTNATLWTRTRVINAIGKKWISTPRHPAC